MREYRRPTMTGETGAIAESIADLFGEFVQWSDAMPSAGDKWLIGESLTGGAVRDMEDPAEYDAPGWRGSALYYYGTTNDTYIHTNNGVGNKLWQLLTDGTSGYRGFAVTALGQSAVEDLLWECLETTLSTGADYTDLYAALRQAAINLYDSGTTPTEADALQSIDEAAMALAIIAPLDQAPVNTKSSGPPFWIWESFNNATVSGDGYPMDKTIPYKVYVPDEDFDGYTSDSRPDTKDWPLDVIILSHGAGQNLNIGIGYEDPGDSDTIIDEDVSGSSDIDGIALHWAKKGYIVVAPTYLKRRSVGAFEWWETPESWDTIEKALTDFIKAAFLDPTEFFTDRVRDLRHIRENLDTIINETSTDGAYVEGTSKVGLAGHSFGAVTTMLAAGAPLKVGQGASEVQLVLEDEGFAREFDNGTASDPDDDYGAFVPADAYLMISGAFDAGNDELQIIDEDLQNLTGKVYVQDPIMMQTAEADPGAVTGSYFKPVTGPFLRNTSPAYGVCIEDANHITPITVFTARAFPNMIRSWNRLSTLTATLGDDDGTTAEKSALSTFNSIIQDWIDDVFTGAGNSQGDEEDRMAEFRRFSVAFWDSHLSTDYDTSEEDELGLSFLHIPDQDMIDDNDDVRDYRRRGPVRALVVRDDSAFPLAQFQSNGHIVLNKGTFYTGFTSFVESASVKQFFIKKQDGTIVAEIDDVYGDFRIRGGYCPNIVDGGDADSAPDVYTTSAREFVVRADLDTGTNAQIVLNDYGNLHMAGEVITETTTFSSPINCP